MVERRGQDGATGAPGALALLALVLVLGGWLLAASRQGDVQLDGAGSLTWLPALAPASWVLYPLAVLFLLGGYTAVRSQAHAQGAPYGAWLRGWLGRAARPVLALLVAWAASAVSLVTIGADGGTVHTLLTMVVAPLWFLPVLGVLIAITPLTARLNPLWPLAVVLHADLYRSGHESTPEWLSWTNVLAVWLVPYCLGASWAHGAFARARTAAALLAVGAAGFTGLVLWAGASPTEPPGLQPPSLTVVFLGLAQCGGALLLRGPLRRWLARPAGARRWPWRGAGGAPLHRSTV
ncbi:hypothetical protein LHJ74_07320 [Streptomyces sp. N2-109]|uniref:Integral membrane protein n=1 Tax=Streptomyces gossypii TaxID=2883101 RepID=A0ABT2JPD5_9ACTN|nr:hypothetical protein [Streptomyces gossypii]MCT2589730.1 hypothetical protein [Streptomyces gossypii]